MKSDTDPDVFLSEINQIRDELGALNETTSTERLTTIILDALPVDMYSTVKLEAIRDPDLSLEQIQQMMRTIFINHSEKLSVTRKIQSPIGIKGRIIRVGKLLVSQPCQLLSSLVINARKQVTKQENAKNRRETVRWKSREITRRQRKSGVVTIKQAVIRISSVTIR